MYRPADGRLRRHTIGRHGSPWTPDAARNEARRLLGEVAAGDDPASEKTAMRGQRHPRRRQIDERDFVGQERERRSDP
jgi:hypothetical protein